MLSHRLPVYGLVSRYLTNYLMGRKPLHRRPKAFVTILSDGNHMRY